VLEILGIHSPLTARQIIGQLVKTEPWQGRTIKTLINRLLKKKAIGYNLARLLPILQSKKKYRKKILQN
jgi:predicted transcriptional regulator